MLSESPDNNDYQRFLRRNGVTWPGASSAHGAPVNGWPSRPWHMDERYHFSNWCADSAIDFLERRDPTAPFFLKVSFIHPHQPVTPPAVYYDRYLAMDLPEPYVGEWARVFDGPRRGLPPESWRTALDPQVMKQYRAAYYGSINHIDDQIGRILALLPRHNTIIVFCADHGEMLGDHQWIRKRNAYEPSARVPLLMNFPQSLDVPQQRAVDVPVELMDIMPTLLDAAGVAVPDTVDGKSLLPYLRGEDARWREFVHGECAEVPSLNSGMQYLTDGKRKYVWFPGAGVEQYFNLENDPCEMEDLSRRPAYADEIEAWRTRLVQELADRPEGFTDGRRLLKLSGPTPFCLPGYERQ